MSKCFRHRIWYFPVCFTETLEVYNLSGSQETDGITDLRVLYQTQNVIICGTRLLLWGDLVKTTYKNTRKNR